VAGAESRVRKKSWGKVVVVIMTGIVAIGSLIFWQRYHIAAWVMNRNMKVQEMAILLMLENARPIIERELKMTLPQKILSSIAGQRNEEERQAAALKDVRIFGEFCFKNHMLKFKDVHSLSSLSGFNLRGFSFALGWTLGNTDEVLAAFNINLFKRKIDKMQINQNCSFFRELRLYIEKKSKEN